MRSYRSSVIRNVIAISLSDRDNERVNRTGVNIPLRVGHGLDPSTDWIGLDWIESGFLENFMDLIDWWDDCNPVFYYSIVIICSTVYAVSFKLCFMNV